MAAFGLAPREGQSEYIIPLSGSLWRTLWPMKPPGTAQFSSALLLCITFHLHG